MNLFHLSASDLMIWGLVLHLIADWPLQNEWMALNKTKRHYRINKKVPRGRPETIITSWWYRHPAAYVHAAIHGVFLATIFGWIAVPIAIVHLIIDTRVVVIWWSKLIGQTQPNGYISRVFMPYKDDMGLAPVYDVGTEVRFWTDQVFHIATIAIAAILVTL